MKRSKSKPTTKRLTKEQRAEEVRAYVALCFSALSDTCESWREVAELTGLHLSTIYRLGMGNASLATHIGTLQALGYAAGFEIVLTETDVNFRLVG